MRVNSAPRRTVKYRLIGRRSLLPRRALYLGYTDDYAGPGTDSHEGELFEFERVPADTSWASLGEVFNRLGVDYRRMPSPSGMENMVLYCVYNGDDPYGEDDGIITETKNKVYFSDGLNQYGVPRDSGDLEQRILDYVDACRGSTARRQALRRCVRVSTRALRLGLTRKGGKGQWKSMSLSTRARTRSSRASSRT